MRRRDLMRSALCLTGSASLLPLTGCGGGTASASIRCINATVDYATADFWVQGSKAFSALTNGGSVTAWGSVDAGDTQIELHAAGSSTSKLTETRSLAEDTYTSTLAYGSLATSLKFQHFAETNAAPASGSVQLRLFQASPSLDGLDLYITNTSSLTGLSPTLSVSTYAELSAFITMTSGNYRLRLTAGGDQTNVLFDYTSGANLYSTSILTLIVAPRASGSLPNLTALPERASGVLLSNALVA
jgi:hypothetical protein